MREQIYGGQGKKIENKILNNLGANRDLPIVVSARTGLSGKKDAILAMPPIEYAGKSVREALNYVLEQEGMKENDLALAESVRNELAGKGSAVMVNGKSAKLTDKIDEYLVEKKHELPNGEIKQYQQLEIEISSVQQGGYLIK
jgi:hypothetical protein